MVRVAVPYAPEGAAVRRRTPAECVTASSRQSSCPSRAGDIDTCIGTRSYTVSKRVMSSRCRALEQTSESDVGPTPSSKDVYYELGRDPYFQAGQRLDRLLSGVGDGEDELLDSMLEQQSVEKKVGLAALAGSLVCGAAVLCCVFLELDPFGGMKFGISSIQAGLVGALVSVPLCAFKNALWSESADKELPFLTELQRTQINDFKPILTGLSPLQRAIILACEVVPTILIVYPAFVGGISNMLEMYRTSSEGINNVVPETLPPLVALSIVALLSGISKIIDQGPSPEEYDVIRDALENADRYYKVMAGPGENNARSEEAFKNVSLMWLARRQVGARFAGALSSFEIFYLGLLWLETGDLAAPLVAALALNAVDFVQVANSLPESNEIKMSR
jgi:hypothetical protein